MDSEQAVTPEEADAPALRADAGDDDLSPEAVAGIQRNAIRALIISQIFGSIAVSAGFAMGGLIMEEATGSAAYAGLAQAAATLGGAACAVPAARLALRSGRRVSLAATYLLAAFGGVFVVGGSAWSAPVLLLAGMFMFGAGQAAGLQVRFAGVDLSEPARRGRTLSILLFAYTIGGVTGPNLAEPASHIATWLRLPGFSGAFFISIALLTIASVWVLVRLRPDPLKVARQLAARRRAKLAVQPEHTSDHLSIVESLKLLWKSYTGRIGLLAAMGGQASMVAVMVMTPVHIGHTGHGLDIVGIVISAHVLGMYAFSPVMGWFADRYGPRAVVLLGAAILLLSCAISGLASDNATVQLTLGLFLLGLGWSGTLVGSSLLITATTDEDHRPSVQGASDLMMMTFAALVASVSGLIVAWLSYAALNILAAIIVMPMLLALFLGRQSRTVRT